jgi:hypothetical protein
MLRYLGNSLIIFFVTPILLGLIYSPLFFVFPPQNAKADTVSTSVDVTITPSVCGNGIQEPGEQCDGADLGGQTCISLGFISGTLSCNLGCTFNTSGCFTGGGGGGGGGGAPPSPTITKVIIKGKAYPGAEITLLEDGTIATNEKADFSANFRIEIKDITPGIWTFSLWAEDQEGRKSTTFSFTTSVAEDVTTTISGIFLPPTIELSKVNLQKGESLDIFGQTAPESEISISVESEEIVKKTEADEKGNWDYTFDTSLLDKGSHTTRAKSSSLEGLLSSFSKILSFYVGEGAPEIIEAGADFNNDGRIDLIDFSILLYWWGEVNENIDLNGNGIVDLADFSIMLYWWTG